MLVDPSEVMSLGRALGVRAEAVASVREKLATQLGQASWTGTGATRFRYDAAQFDRRLAQDAEELRVVKAAVERLADALAAELQALRTIEERVRSWLLLNRTVPPPWPPSSLPPQVDPRWREVERAFVAAGIPLDAAAVAPAPAGGDWKATLSPAEAWIIQRESNFDPTAVNPSSGAFGIWQGLGDTLNSYADRFGFDRHTADPAQQLKMFRAYVKDRYGNAENAMAFWQKHQWY